LLLFCFLFQQLFLCADGSRHPLCSINKPQGGTSVSWRTPLGLPVVQPYRRPGRKQVRTVVANVVLATDNSQLPVDTARQTSAFPPNYVGASWVVLFVRHNCSKSLQVHSLDSTHMFLTALACQQRDITFAAVHDSYLTHPCTVETMSDILREEFVRLHSQPLLERLRNDWRGMYPSVQLPAVPQRGSLQLAQVTQSPYFFH